MADALEPRQALWLQPKWPDIAPVRARCSTCRIQRQNETKGDLLEFPQPEGLAVLDWRCLIWPMIRLLIWVAAVVVITIVVTKAGLDLPTAIGVVIGGVFVSRELYRWVVRGETPPDVLETA